MTNKYNITIDRFKKEIRSRRRAEKAERQCKRALNRLSAELADMAERERREVASELHDRIGQNLALVKLKLDDLRIDPDDQAQFIQIGEMLSHIIDETRQLVFEISPPMLYKLGLIPAVQWLGENIENDHGLSVRLAIDIRTCKLDQQIEILCFRIIRELLVNAVKHSNASRVDLAISQSDTGLSVSVQDNGRGSETAKMRSAMTGRVGFGLLNIQHQVEYAGGVFTIKTKPGAGLNAEFTLPTGNVHINRSSWTEAVK